jgi:putative spermidine/putrescine transport system ATP-binding protein
MSAVEVMEAPVMTMSAAPPPEAEPIIRLEGLSKAYGDFTALHRTDISVRRGEFLTLLGPSGSGKSTILNLISGAVAASSGRILLDGRDVTVQPARERGIGMVFQNYALMPHMSVFDNVAYPLKIRGLPKSEIASKVRDVLARVGLTGFEARKPRQLSGGQQQRVGIARCIVYSPKIILMDEPLGALDKNMRDQMQEEIKRLHTELGTTIIYVTHDQEEALNLSDTVCLMEGGRVAQIGTPEQLYFEPANIFAAQFIGESNLFDVMPVEAGLLRAADGTTFRPAATAKSGAKVLVRPEKLRIVAAEHAPPDGVNTLSGSVDHVSFVGGMTRLTIRAANGASFVAKNISERAALRVKAGDRLHVAWDDGDVIVLNG